VKECLPGFSGLLPEEAFGGVAHRAFPGFENIGERCTGGDMMQEVPLHRLIQISAQRTLVSLHYPILAIIYYYLYIFQEKHLPPWNPRMRAEVPHARHFSSIAGILKDIPSQVTSHFHLW